MLKFVRKQSIALVAAVLVMVGATFAIADPGSDNTAPPPQAQTPAEVRQEVAAKYPAFGPAGAERRKQLEGAVGEERLAQIGREVSADATDAVAPVVVGRSDVEGAPVAVAAGTGGTCLIVVGTNGEPGSAGCGDPDQAPHSARLEQTYLGNSYRLTGLMPEGVNEVKLSVGGQTITEPVSVTGVVSVKTAEAPASITWTDADGEHTQTLGGIS